MGIYINGIGSISAQRFSPQQGEYEFVQPESTFLPCIEPDYKDLIPPMQLRRMSKVVRIGIASAKQALQDAELSAPDMITIGTAYGCLADTENFLSKLITQDEQMLTPTAFIQSTHNTVSGQIALMTQCVGHNFTFVHRGHSFETSLQEAMMLIEENAHKPIHVLTGGIDEMTQHSFQIIERFGTFKNAKEINSTHSDGTTAGEGSNLFLLSNSKQASTYAELLDLKVCNGDDIAKALNDFLHSNGLSENEIDTCLVGINEDQRYDEIILKNIASIQHAELLSFKNWCGEYPTSNAFAFGLACSMLKHGIIPNELKMQSSSETNSPSTILIYNHYKNRNHSFILLRKA